MKMVARALMRVGWESLSWSLFVGNRDEGKGMNGVGWEKGGKKKTWKVVSGVVDRNVWRCGSMALAVGVAWVA